MTTYLKLRPVVFAILLASARPILAQSPPAYHPDRVLVKLKDNLSLASVSSLKTDLQANVLHRYTPLGAELWQIKNVNVEKVLQLYKNDSRIEYIEPDYVITADQKFPNDPEFSQLWGLHNTGQTGGTPGAHISAGEAWEIQTGGEVLVGVIDTGVDYNHEDLTDNMWTNPGEIPNNGIDDDNNGYIDDVYGWDFLHDDNDPFDACGHGTHVAGTIAAVGNNGIGVSGVSWSAKIMALKFMDSFIFWCAGYTSDAIEAILYASLMGAKVTNNSWGTTRFSQALHDAIAYAGARGQLFVAAAHNDGGDNDLDPRYPASYDLDNIIAVAATDHNDSLAWFSNYGISSVDLGAPGEAIFSTVPGNSYGFSSGTSMAAPHVTGAASLIWSQHPTMSTPGIKQQILNSVDRIPALVEKTVSGGRLNLRSALLTEVPFSVVLVDTSLTTAARFQAKDFISAGPKVMISSSANVVFYVLNDSSTGIMLKPGFTAQAGSAFRAFLASGVTASNRNRPLSSVKTKAVAQNENPYKRETGSGLEKTGVRQTESLPNEFNLAQNYPNPFNPTTTIRYALPQAARVTLTIYNLQGQEVRTLVDGLETAGYKATIWDGKNNIGQAVPSGIYLYRLVADEFVQMRRMVLLK